MSTYHARLAARILLAHHAKKTKATRDRQPPPQPRADDTKET